MFFSRIAAIFAALYIHRKNGGCRLHFKGLSKTQYLCVRMEIGDREATGMPPAWTQPCIGDRASDGFL
jgi:hypothetical protein